MFGSVINYTIFVLSLMMMAKKNKTMATLNQIFGFASKINAKTTTVSSMGSFIDANASQKTDRVITEIMSALPKESLAYNIISTNKNSFSTKQLWVIAFELQKNASFCEMLDAGENEKSVEIEFEKISKQIKREAKKTKATLLKQTVETNKVAFENEKSTDLVKHFSFGIGKVIGQDEETITIVFEKAGEKKLLKRLAQLENI